MFDATKLQEALTSYKSAFPTRWKSMKYKWKAVQHFQDLWNPDAPDFALMLSQALLPPLSDLLASRLYYPDQMLKKFVTADPASVRTMFTCLFDESKSLKERIDRFITISEKLRDEYFINDNNHFQDALAANVYLSLRYPEKYFNYRIQEMRSAYKALSATHQFARAYAPENQSEVETAYHEISKLMSEDLDCHVMLKERLTADCYGDPNFYLLAGDFIKYVGHDWEPVRVTETEPVTSYNQPACITYTKKDFLKDVFMDEASYDSLVSLLKRKKNIILTGASGVGKTFAARRLAFSIMGMHYEARAKLIQFHSGYSYDDFVMGFKPTSDGMRLKAGVFYQFCKQAEALPKEDFFFIIDELNRGDVSQIFGDLFMLLDAEHRGSSITLTRSSEEFSIPENLYIIATMNQTKRGLQSLDPGLYRRFGFFEMKPAFQVKSFRDYQSHLCSSKLDAFINLIISLNETIARNPALGPSFCIGHSLFCNLQRVNNEFFQQVILYELIPLIEEYYHDDLKTCEQLKLTLKGYL